jgi:hypothetical protein
MICFYDEFAEEITGEKREPIQEVTSWLGTTNQTKVAVAFDNAEKKYNENLNLLLQEEVICSFSTY